MGTFEKMINLDTKVEAFVVKIIINFIFEINKDSRDTKIDLIKVLLQLNIIGFGIKYLKTVLFFLISCLVDIITKE